MRRLRRARQRQRLQRRHGGIPGGRASLALAGGRERGPELSYLSLLRDDLGVSFRIPVAQRLEFPFEHGETLRVAIDTRRRRVRAVARRIQHRLLRVQTGESVQGGGACDRVAVEILLATLELLEVRHLLVRSLVEMLRPEIRQLPLFGGDL